MGITYWIVAVIVFLCYGIFVQNWFLAVVAGLLWPFMIAYFFLSLYYGAGRWL